MRYTNIMPPLSEEHIIFLKSSHLFYHIAEEDYDRLREAVKLVQFNPGDVIFQSGAEARYFYLIYAGEVEVSVTVDEGAETLAVLHSGEYFGQDALRLGMNYRSNAKALRATSAFRIQADAFEKLALAVPELVPPVRLIWETYELLLRNRLDWLNEDEVVHYFGRKHRFFLLTRLLLPLIIFVLAEIPLILVAAFVTPTPLMALLALLVGVFLVGLMLWNLVDWSNDYYIITSERVIYLERVVLLYDSRQESPLQAILSVTSDSSQLGRIIGYGNVTISTYTGDIVLRRLPDPQEVVILLNEKRALANERSRQTERQTIEKDILQRLGYIQSSPESGQPAPAQVHSGAVNHLLANLFRMRFEQGGVITYRTHWFILLKRTFLPGFLMTLVLAGLILRLTNTIQILDPARLVGLAAILEVILAGWWIYRYADWNNDRYIITRDTLIDLYRKPLGREERKTAPIKNIQTIEYERRNLIGLIFNFGTVSILVGDTRLTFDDVYNPSEVQKTIFERFMIIKKQEQEKADSKDRQRIADWLEIYDHIRQTRPDFSAGKPDDSR